MDAYSHCTLCPRMCGVDRHTATGRCGMGSRMTAARAMPHFGEEPPVSGTRGSGAVFFSGCALGCAFCQNDEISNRRFGKELDSERLRTIFDTLIAQGVHNLNLVTATHFLPSILPALTPRPPVPVVWNTGGYERVETIRMLEGLVDVYLPDLKFSDAALARRLCGAPDYFEAATAAIREMYRQTGPVELRDGLIRRGVIIRHLILPGNIENSLAVLDWIAGAFPPGAVYVSLMSQYVPMGRARSLAPFDRRLTRVEYDAVRSWMELDGLRWGFTQDFSSATASWIPDFSLEGL